MNNNYSYDKINQDYTVKQQKDDAFESTIKEEKKRQTQAKTLWLCKPALMTMAILTSKTKS